MKTGDNIKIKIEKLVFGGEGLGYYDGITFFVPMSVPGDEVEAEIISLKKDYGRALIKKIIEPSKDRIADIIYDTILHTDNKISNKLLNDKNVINIYGNNSRNVERLLRLDDYVKNPETLAIQRNLISIKNTFYVIWSTSYITRTKLVSVSSSIT